MRWRALLIGAALLLAGQARADTADEVKRSVHVIQEAFNKGDAEKLKGLMTEDHVSVLTYARITGAAALLKSLGDFKFTEYRISDQKVRDVTRDVAIVSHLAAIKGTYKGKEV